MSDDLLIKTLIRNSSDSSLEVSSSPACSNFFPNFQIESYKDAFRILSEFTSDSCHYTEGPTETDRKAERQRKKERERQTDRQTDRQTERARERIEREREGYTQ